MFGRSTTPNLIWRRCLFRKVDPPLKFSSVEVTFFFPSLELFLGFDWTKSNSFKPSKCQDKKRWSHLVTAKWWNFQSPKYYKNRPNSQIPLSISFWKNTKLGPLKKSFEKNVFLSFQPFPMSQHKTISLPRGTRRICILCDPLAHHSSLLPFRELTKRELGSKEKKGNETKHLDS